MKTLVIKIGSGTLLTKRARLDEFHIAHIVDQVRHLRARGYGVVLVVSGAVACGLRHVSPADDPVARSIAAGIGQISIVSTLHRLFSAKGMLVAQMLLTRSSLSTKGQRDRLRLVLRRYLDAGIVAIANENDVIELNGFGGNDLLAARIARLIDAQQVLILSQMTRSAHGVGGGETKLRAVQILRRSGVHAQIINGKDRNGIVESTV